MTKTDRIFVFDLDGVVTDPRTDEVSDAVLIYIIEDLKMGRLVAFNTGRPYEWVVERILPKIKANCSPQELENLLVVAEMGSVVCTFNQGVLNVEVDSSATLPSGFTEDVQALLRTRPEPQGHVFAEIMEWDVQKKTMGSLAKRDTVEIGAYNALRPHLTSGLQALIEKHKLDDFVIGQTTIATDIQHQTAGKHKGASQVLSWLGDKKTEPSVFYAFGDSVSDKAMADIFVATGTRTIFVFVGDPTNEHEVSGDAYETVVMQGRHSSDTAEFLSRVG